MLPLEKITRWLSIWFGRIFLLAVFLFLLVDTIEKGQLWANVVVLILVVIAYREGRKDENTRIYLRSIDEIAKEQEKRKAEGAALVERMRDGGR
jgi:hypothetical protein